MLIAAIVLAAATTGLFLTSLVAVATWQKGRAQDRADAQAKSVLDGAKDQFVGKDYLNNVLFAGVVAAAVLAIGIWGKKPD
jgi:hypothetical protein